MARRTINLAGIEAEIIHIGPMLVDERGRKVVVGGRAWGEVRQVAIYEVPSESAHDFVDALIGFPSGRPHAYPDDPGMACVEVEAKPVPGPFSWRDLLPWNWSKPPRLSDRWEIHARYEQFKFEPDELVTADPWSF